MTALANRQVGDVTLRHGCDVRSLPRVVRDRFVELPVSAETVRWVEQAYAQPQSRSVSMLAALARSMVGTYDANGLTGAAPMWVLATDQWRQLLDAPPRAALLDVGAGDGEVTATLAPLFERVVATELSAPMARRLRARGYVCHELDLAHASLPGRSTERFDVIALINVLDRTVYPRTLLARCREHVAPDGKLVVVVPVPVRPVVLAGPVAAAPEEPIPNRASSFEGAVGELWTQLLEPAGLALEAVARTPYLCRGDRRAPVSVLDDAIFVCRPAG